MPIMVQVPREKIALGIFALLIVASVGAFVWYFFAGHSWNVAATNIDDRFGSMEGYTALLYTGTTPREAATKSSENDAITHPKKMITVISVQKDYEKKGAQTILLDISDTHRYSDGLIVKRGSKRFGIVSLTPFMNPLTKAPIIKRFEQARVDMVVAIMPRKAYARRLTGIDVALCTDEGDLLSMGEMANGTLYVGSPLIGQVGVVLVSPTNVVSAKVVSVQ